jgi:hypothetical protein
MFEPNTPSYRDRKDFERNAFLISELIKRNQLSINIEMKGKLRLDKVRYAPNERLNIDTIDEGVRSMMHMMNGGILDQMKNNIQKDDKEE